MAVRKASQARTTAVPHDVVPLERPAQLAEGYALSPTSTVT